MEFIEERPNTCHLAPNKISFVKTFAKLKAFHAPEDEELYTKYFEIYKKEIEIFKSFTHYLLEKLKRKSILSKNLILPDDWRYFKTILEDEKNYLEIFDSKNFSQKNLERIQNLFVIFGNFLSGEIGDKKWNQNLKHIDTYYRAHKENSDIKVFIQDYSDSNLKMIKSLVKINDPRFLVIILNGEYILYDKIKETILSKPKYPYLVKNRCLLLADLYLFIYAVRNILYFLK